MDFAELEKREGVRLSWNAWPSSRIEATRVVLPFGAVCTPVKPMPEMPVLPYAPVVCTECSAVLNPFCMVDYHQKRWQCCLCNVMNQLPRNYHGARKGRGMMDDAGHDAGASIARATPSRGPAPRVPARPPRRRDRAPRASARARLDPSPLARARRVAEPASPRARGDPGPHP